MNDELVNRILDMLESIGGTLATEGFDLAVRYVRTEAIVSGIFLLFGLTVCALVFYYSAKKMTAERDWFDASPLYLILAIFSGVSAPFLVASLYGSVMRLLVPEWYAVQALFGLVTGGG